MARECLFTGKKTQSGNNRSHSMRATKRTYKPNLINTWADLGDGIKVKIKVCSKIYKKMRGFI